MPTPRPIITPMNGAKSGTSMTWLARMTKAPPRPMPNSATPTGSPMASTEPNATIRMTTANARPNSSAEGCSNSAKRKPPSSTRSPSTSGTSSRISSPMSAARVKSMSSGRLTVANAIVPGASPWVEIWNSPPGAYGLCTDSDVVDLGHLGEQLLHRRLDLGVVDALRRPAKTIWPDCGEPLPSSNSDSTSAKPSVDSKPSREKSCR